MASTLKRKGPYTRLLLEIETVREKPDGPLIARHQGHEWLVDGEGYARLDVEGRVDLQFVDAKRSARYRATGLFSSVDGVAYRDGRVLAYIDVRRGRWIRQDDGAEWPVLLVEPAR